MKTLFFLLIAALAAPAAADTIILKDGTRLEGVIEGEMDDASLIRTRYGSLTVKKTEIKEVIPETRAPETAPPAVEVSTPAPVAISTGAAVEISSAAAAEPPAAAAPPAMTFATVSLGTSAVLKIYSEDGVIAATETWSPAGELISREGAVKDGVWKEFYPDGGIKSEKAVLGGANNGPLRTFYPSGALQTEANYLAGRLNGPMITYTEDAAPLFEQNFANGRLHGVVREYNPDASVKSETLYADGAPVASQAPSRPASPAGATAQTGAAAPKSPPSAYAVKSQSLARGERYSFFYEDRYRGRVILDSSFNLTSLSGSLPDGSAVFYGADGSPEKEFVFSGGGLAELKVFGPGAAAYRYEKGKAIKK